MSNLQPRLVGGLEALACLALLAMMLLVVADVAGRYVVGRPLPGAIELVQYAMVVVVFAALPSVTLRRRHISLDLLHNLLPGAARRVQWAAVCLASASVLGAQAWLLLNRAGTMRENADVIGFLGLPVHPAAYFMALLSTLGALVALLAGASPDPAGERN